MLTGHNQENFFLASDSQSIGWLIDSIPQGEEYCFRFRQDKEDSDTGDIAKLIELNNTFKVNNRILKVIYCANVKKEATIVKNDIDFLINSGVDIIAVEFGNETYAATHADFNFNIYKDWFEPLRSLIHTTYPTMPCLVFLAPRANESGVLGGRNDHSIFNNAAIEYISTHASIFPVAHIYFNSRECPVLSTPLEERDFIPGAYYIDLDNFYRTVREEAQAQLSLWDKTLSYIVQSTGKKVYITEWGFDNYATIKNTLAIGDIAWRIWNSYSKDDRITLLLQHNGLSMALAGFICPSKKQDSETTPNVRRVDYWVYKMFRACSNIQETISAPGVYQFPCYLGDNPTVLDYSDDLEVEKTENFLITGENIYSSSGATEWMSKNSTPSYEINGIVDSTNKPFFFGYTEITFKPVIKNSPPVANAGKDITIYVNEYVNLSAKDSEDDKEITSYIWYDAHDLILGTKVDLTLRFSKEGVYPIFLEVKDSEGLTSEDSVVVTVKKKKRFNFNWFRTPIKIGKPNV